MGNASKGFEKAKADFIEGLIDGSSFVVVIVIVAPLSGACLLLYIVITASLLAFNGMVWAVERLTETNSLLYEALGVPKEFRKERWFGRPPAGTAEAPVKARKEAEKRVCK